MDEWDLLAKKWAAERQAQNLANAQNTAANTSGGGGFFEGIGSVLSGIGNSIGNVGSSLYNMFGTGVASVRDLVTGNAGTGKYQNEWKDYLKGAQYGDANMSDKDYYAKTAGNSLNAAATLSDFIPGLGKGAKAALNIGQGVASGVGNEFAQNGANATLEGALKGAAIGGVGAGVGQAVGGALANKAAGMNSNKLLGKALQSNIGRGAITGAASGAVGSGLSTALEGGNFGQTLSSALQGAGQGSLAGATTSAIYGLAGKAADKFRNKIEVENVNTRNERIAKRDAAIEQAKQAGIDALSDWAKKSRGYDDDSIREFRRQKTYEDAFTSEAKRLGLSDKEIKNSMKLPEFDDVLEWAGASRQYPAEMAIDDAKITASRAVDDFLAKHGGMSSDGEINGVYEDAFVKEATRAGLGDLEINNALNEALRTNDVDYMGNRSRLARASEYALAEMEATEARRAAGRKANAPTKDELLSAASRASSDEMDATSARRAAVRAMNDESALGGRSAQDLSSEAAYKEMTAKESARALEKAVKEAKAFYEEQVRETGTTSSPRALMAWGEFMKAESNLAEAQQAAKLNKTAAVKQSDETKPLTEGQRRRQTAMDWKDESLSGGAKKKNYLQKLGGDLQQAAQATRDSAVYGRLKGNTAQEMINKDAINSLRKDYGYSPDDYEQASKLSTAVNKWYDNEVKSSGAEKVNTKLVNELALESNNTLPAKYEKAYRESINTAMNMANAGDSGAVDTYSAAGLERAAKYLGDQEQKYRRTSMNGVDGRVDGDRAELADYYKKARQTLRNEINSMIELDDITKNNLSKMLDDAGATAQAKSKILSSQSFSEVKSNTAPLEDARTMYNQMRSSGLKRGANADSSTSLGKTVFRAVGGDNLLEAGAKPIRTGASIAEKAVGKGIEYLGNVAAGEGGLGKVASGIQNVAKGAESGLNTNVLGQTVGDIANRQIARQTALGLAENQNRAREYADAQEALTNAQTNYANAVNAYNSAAAQQVTPAQQAGAETLSRIENAMQLALNAGDLTSYSKLADLYKQAYNIYGTQTQAANPLSKLSSTQVENVNKLDTASNAIDELEALFNKAGGGQGLVGGNAANFLAALGLNSDVATYNSISRGLINQIGAAIGKTDSLNTEGEVNRALELIPKFTDDAQTARNKLAQLRQMLNTNKQTVYQNYGLTQ